jgi:hypothetical protein
MVWAKNEARGSDDASRKEDNDSDHVISRAAPEHLGVLLPPCGVAVGIVIPTLRETMRGKEQSFVHADSSTDST